MSQREYFALRFSDAHFTRPDFEAMERCVDPEQREAFAAHLASCPACADAYAAYLCEGALCEMPAGLPERLLASLPSAAQEKTAAPARSRARILQLFKFSIAAAMAITLYSVGFFDMMTNPNFQKSVADRTPPAEQVQQAAPESDSAAPDANRGRAGGVIAFGDSIKSNFFQFADRVNNLYDKGADPT